MLIDHEKIQDGLLESIGKSLHEHICADNPNCRGWENCNKRKFLDAAYRSYIIELSGDISADSDERYIWKVYYNPNDLEETAGWFFREMEGCWAYIQDHDKQFYIEIAKWHFKRLGMEIPKERDFKQRCEYAKNKPYAPFNRIRRKLEYGGR